MPSEVISTEIMFAKSVFAPTENEEIALLVARGYGRNKSHVLEEQHSNSSPDTMRTEERHPVFDSANNTRHKNERMDYMNPIKKESTSERRGPVVSGRISRTLFDAARSIIDGDRYRTMNDVVETAISHLVTEEQRKNGGEQTGI